MCTDCHSVHDMRPASDSRSSVHPLNVAATCSRCHSDAARMKSYSIPTDQFAGYSVSVHHEALAVRGDLSAPTCTTCHGNHGAAPPGVASVENVCSNCHVFQAQLFDTSPHKEAFAAAKMPGCVTCHSNHRIQHPTDAMLGAGPQSVCTNCHAAGDGGFKVATTTHEKLTGLDSAESGATAKPSLYLPSGSPTVGLDQYPAPSRSSSPSASASSSGSATPSPTPTKKQPKITLQAFPQQVSPGQRINLTGVYRGGEGARLQVERFEGGRWNDFPVGASVSGGQFTTYITTSRTGPQRFRVVDPLSNARSNAVRVTVG